MGKVKVRFVISYEFETEDEPKKKEMDDVKEELSEYIQDKINLGSVLELSKDMELETVTVKKKTSN